MYGLSRTVDPAAEPVTLAQAKAHLRIVTAVTDEDTLIEDRLIPAARQYMEEQTGRSLITQTWRLTVHKFPRDKQILLPRPPLISVTSLKYYDGAGDQQTWNAANYDVVSTREPGYIIPAWNVSWPGIRERPDAVEVIYTAGYGAASTDLPLLLIQGILMYLTHLYENRNDVEYGKPVEVPKSSQSIAATYAAGDEFYCYEVA